MVHSHAARKHWLVCGSGTDSQCHLFRLGYPAAHCATLQTKQPFSMCIGAKQHAQVPQTTDAACHGCSAVMESVPLSSASSAASIHDQQYLDRWGCTGIRDGRR